MPGRIILNVRSDGTVFTVPSSGLSYFSENFEGTGFENSWSSNAGAGTINPDFTVSVYEGSQSLRIASDAAGVSYTSYDFGVDVDEIWLFLALNTQVVLPSTDALIIELNDSVDTALCGFVVQSAGDVYIKHGSVASEAFTPASGYYILWIRYKKGTGSNGEMDVYYSTNETFPGAPTRSITTGTSTTSARKIVLSHRFGGEAYFDHLRADDAAIGSDPT